MTTITEEERLAKKAKIDAARSELVEKLYPRAHKRERLVLDIEIGGQIEPGHTQALTVTVPLMWVNQGGPRLNDDFELCWLAVMQIGDGLHHVDAILVWTNPVTGCQEAVADPNRRLEDAYAGLEGEPFQVNHDLADALLGGPGIDLEQLGLGIIIHIRPYGD